MIKPLHKYILPSLNWNVNKDRDLCKPAHGKLSAAGSRMTAEAPGLTLCVCAVIMIFDLPIKEIKINPFHEGLFLSAGEIYGRLVLWQTKA